MSAKPAQLRLVTEPTPGHEPDHADRARRVFAHWVFMLGRNPKRCKMDPTRAAVIRAALSIYGDDDDGEDVLMMAIEGMAADPLADVSAPRMREAMREIEWFLARAARVERWAGQGEALRSAARHEVARPQPVGVAADPVAEAQARAAAAQARERLRVMANARRALGDA